MTQKRASFGNRQGGLAPAYQTRAHSMSGAAVAYGQPAPTQGYGGYQPPSGSPPGGIVINTGRVRPAIWMRYVSGIIDLVILFFLTMGLFAIFDWKDGGFAAGAPTTTQTQPGLLLAVLILWFAYGIVFEASSWQGTPGKKVTGLIVTDEYGERPSFGQVLLRGVAKILSGCVPFYISYTMMHWQKKKKTLHDLMVGTRVYRRSDAGPGTSSYFE